MNSVTLEMAKRLILKKQMLSQPVTNGSKQVVEVVRKLCGVQYDPLPVVEQAHYLLSGIASRTSEKIPWMKLCIGTEA